MATSCLVIAFSGTLNGCDKGSPVATPTAAPDRASVNLTHALTPAAPFKLHKDTGKTVVYTFDGGVGPDVPKVILTKSSKVFLNNPQVREVGPQVFIEEFPDITTPADFKTQPVTYDGFAGYETTAIVFHAATRVKMHAYCAKLYASDGTYTILGLAPVEAQALQQLRDAAATFTAR